MVRSLCAGAPSRGAAIGAHPRGRDRSARLFAYLDPLTTSLRELPAAEAELRTLTSDNAAQQARLDDLRRIIGDKIAELARTMERAQAGDREGALGIVRTNEGRDLMARLQATIGAFDRTEEDLQSVRADRAAFRRTLLVAFIVVGLSTRRAWARVPDWV
ncbi:CHASE3 domain sensor protein [Methylobacterium brachiatum]|uniref:CHASE3 domain sensor protein n=1 Tax=Methylobacterium brachiatum TaxID=269660 RepID=A0AAJ1TV77_9HYPH|nr:CHASE3 domain-containing protein [Methylobacterium brachiatum]MDQ0547520.1 CHASE3 domain sensor protein [Methylobacterium brachiatum]